MDIANFVNELKERYQRLLVRMRSMEDLVRWGVVITILLVSIVAVGALMQRGRDEDLGRWIDPIEPRILRETVAIQYDRDTGKLSLALREDVMASLLPNREDRSLVAAHRRRFNRAVAGRTYKQPGVVRGRSDCLFSVLLQAGEDGIRPILQIKDLSVYDMLPAGKRTRKQLGSIHFAPESGKMSFFSDGDLGFFLDTDTLASPKLHVPLKQSGIYNGSKVVLTDERGLERATMEPDPTGGGVVVTPGNDSAVFIDNNPPLVDAAAVVESGEVMEIGGRFFEVQIADHTPLAQTRTRLDVVKRVYPMGDLFHIVGPVSLKGDHQSLGIEYMFQEYLEGSEEQNVPPGEMWLTLDRRLQSRLSVAIKEHVGESKRGTLSGLIMDARSGAILAMASTPNVYNPEDKREVLEILQDGDEHFYNHGAFRRHVIGSTTKVFHGFMALQIFGNSVLDLRVDADGEVRNLLGHRLYGRRDAFMKVKYNDVSFSTYLIKSDNPYQHTLGLLMLSGIEDLGQVPSSWFTPGRRTLKPTRNLEPLQLGDLGTSRDRLRLSDGHPMARELENLFDIQPVSYEGGFDDREIGIYGPRFIEHASEVLKLVNANVRDAKRVLVRRSTICAPESPRMEIMDVRNTMDASNLLYGANRNRWTDVKMCESFSRIMVEKRVQARLVSRYRDSFSGEIIDLEAEALANTPDLQVANPSSFKTMRRILSRVPRRAGGGWPEGTAFGLEETLRSIEREIPGFTLVGKTGTIDDGRKGDPDSRLFLGSFGVMVDESFEGPVFTFAIYIKNARDKDSVVNLLKKELPEWARLLKAREEARIANQQAESAE